MMAYHSSTRHCKKDITCNSANRSMANDGINSIRLLITACCTNVRLACAEERYCSHEETLYKIYNIIQGGSLKCFFVADNSYSNLYLYFNYFFNFSPPGKRVIIYGAGSAGRQLAAAMDTSKNMKVCGFVDDEVSLQKRSAGGYRIFSNTDIEMLIERYLVTHIFLAIPSASSKRRAEIANQLSNFDSQFLQ